MFFLFWRSLRYRWFECVLAAAVVAIPIAALTAQRALSSSSEERIHELAHSLGGNMLILPSDTDLADFYTLKFGRAAMPDVYPQKVLQSPVAKNIGIIQSRLYGNIERAESPLVVVGQIVFARGREFDPLPPGQVMLGPAASGKLGLKKRDKLTLKGRELSIEGVIERPPDGLDLAVFSSLPTAQGILAKPSQINAMRMAGCWCRTDVPALAASVESVLPGTRAVTVAGMLKAQKGTVAEVKRYSAVALGAATFVIAGIVLVLTSSQVKRQMREIGLLIATGASPYMIALVFVLKAGIVGVLGGFAGYLLGFPLTARVAATMIGLPLGMPESLLGITVGLSVTVSVIAALVPALRAARLDPTRVLREI